ncbi:MAG: hypothetical protein A3H28_14660 [Acidobacteria bacterium RIFCSPLOWO2_02_FULL_61_28]|nr:MAG: hypothetical protein A3H28_14660 [Acidobacteria bacterium RIFCSPLOWO2_02_FULL_61_28]
MRANLDQFQAWIDEKSREETYFSGTFWVVFSMLGDHDLGRALELQAQTMPGIPLADSVATISVRPRKGRAVQATFWHLPISDGNLHFLFSLDKPSKAIRSMYKLLARAKGKAQLFPIGHSLVKTTVRLNPNRSFEETHILRGVSYPSKPNEGGADINLRPGNASAFFERLEDEKRVLGLPECGLP